MGDIEKALASEEGWNELADLWQQAPTEQQSVQQLQKMVTAQTRKMRAWALIECGLTTALIALGIYWAVWGSTDKQRLIAALLLFYSPLALAWSIFSRAPVYRQDCSSTTEYLALARKRIQRGYLLIKVSWLQLGLMLATLLGIYWLDYTGRFNLGLNGPWFLIKCFVAADVFWIWAILYRKHLRRREQTIEQLQVTLME